MPKVNLAERMLEIVTTSSRAASIVGDLEEEAANRTAFWFWVSLLRICTAHVLQDLRIHWLRMMWLGFSEFLIFVIVAMILESITRSYLPTAQYLRLCLPILIGWHIASRFHGRELASGVSLVSVVWIYKFVSVLPMFWIPPAILPMQLQGNPFTELMHRMLHVAPFNTLIMLGSLLCRSRMNVRRRKLHTS